MSKKKDLVGRLEEVSGLRREQINAIWDQVRENQKKLSECEGPHDFEQEGNGVRREYRCKKCNGVVSAIHHHWYQKGLEHGSRGKR